jgi:pyruvate,orthophosphate dikinase
MHVSQAIVTVRGGMTSHAAVVARGMGKCCVAGCSAIKIDEEAGTMTVAGNTLKEGDVISIDGSSGCVYIGELEKVAPDLSNDFAQIMKWADEIRRLKIRTNADTPADAAQAVKFGAQGIGLCRTEHMFFGEDRIKAMRRMILAEDVEERKEALKLLLPYQKGDFKGIFEAMEDRPVTIRLIDPPLHEFVPHTDEEIKVLADDFGLDFTKLKNRVEELKEFNPMLGHRGCRLTITYPEIAEMQAEAIIMAAIELKKEKGLEVVPEIMIPLVGNVKELAYVKKYVVETIEKVFEREGEKVDYIVGTMIEIPRAALTADEVAGEADFFSFGTNDLTQMTLGFSRDDTGKIINEYIEKGVFEEDPFQSLDQTGVGQLVEMAVQKGRKVNPYLKLGICGEHGGDPASIDFCHRVGLDYVSCSPFRVPIARLAAAQAVVREKSNAEADK